MGIKQTRKDRLYKNIPQTRGPQPKKWNMDFTKITHRLIPFRFSFDPLLIYPFTDQYTYFI